MNAPRPSLLKDPRGFILGGRATFTVKNTRTGARFTYRVLKVDQVFHVSLLTGPQNDEHYAYLGTLFDHGRIYRHGMRSRIGNAAPGEVAFRWLWNHFDRLPACIEIWHEGYCARCGRLLTVPESIEAGFGPECIKKV